MLFMNYSGTSTCMLVYSLCPVSVGSINSCYVVMTRVGARKDLCLNVHYPVCTVSVCIFRYILCDLPVVDDVL